MHLLAGLNFSPDMAVALAQQVGITEPAALEIVRVVMSGGFSKPSIRVVELADGWQETVPNNGEAVLISAENPEERVTILITREPRRTIVVDSRQGP